MCCLTINLFLCSSRGTSLSLFIYCIFSFGVIGMDEVYSLWAFTSPHHGNQSQVKFTTHIISFSPPPPHSGGLGFSLYQIGISLSVAGTLMPPTSLFLFPLVSKCSNKKCSYIKVFVSFSLQLERRLGLINCYYLSVCVCIGLSVLMPNLHYLIPVGL